VDFLHVKEFSFILYPQVIKDGKFITGDLGGSAKCSEFTDEIIRKIEAM
jgi:isocitrate/isopropylmalate dehydrogenase